MDNIIIDTNVLIYWDDETSDFYKHTKNLINLKNENKVKLFLSNYSYIDFYKWIETPSDFNNRTPKYFKKDIVEIIDFNLTYELKLKELELKYWNINLDDIIFNSEEWELEIYDWIKFKEIIRLTWLLSDINHKINIKWTDLSIVMDIIFWNIIYNFKYFISNDVKLIKALNRIKNNNIELIRLNKHSKLFWKNMKLVLIKAFTEISFIKLTDYK